MVNCRLGFGFANTELIDTLWNVNVPEACTAGRGEMN